MISSIGKPINSFFSWYLEKRILEIETFIDDPFSIQEKTLTTLLNKASQVQFGINYGFNTISNSDQFKSKVPLNKYDDLKPFIKLMKNGEPNILWPGQVKWFAQSSGTTSNSVKHIPITKDSLNNCHYKGGKDLLSIYYHENPSTQLFQGKHLIAGGSSSTFIGNKKTVVGDLSAIIMQHLPWWCEWRRSPKGIKKVLSEKWEQKLNHIVKHSVNDDVHLIAGVPSWIYLILNVIIQEYKLDNIHEIWPNLELFLHGGVDLSPYESNFKTIAGKPLNFYQNYNATEGFFGLQSDNNSDDMLLMLDYGIYYEFIEKKYWFHDQPPTLSLEDVQLHTPYEIVISTNGGLWRYRLEDTVVFTEKKPFKIKVFGRTNQFMNAFGEELMIYHVEHAVNIAAKKLKAKIGEFTLSSVIQPNERTIGHHLWLFEFIQKPIDFLQFIQSIDDELKKINIDYCAKRKNNSPIGKPEIAVVKKGTFYKWMEKRGKLGGQHKVPRINNSTKYVNEILAINEAY